ncbi:MAG: TonB family protein, partial [Opitutaceae bacterium]|nr:TonB family protein [Opitutaceae bacterium]
MRTSMRAGYTKRRTTLNPKVRHSHDPGRKIAFVAIGAIAPSLAHASDFRARCFDRADGATDRRNRLAGHATTRAHAGSGPVFSGSTRSRLHEARIKKPKVKKTTAPHYPPEIAALGVEGTVAIMVSVDARGRPGKLRVIRSDNLLLNQAALDTVARWEFSPGRVGGEPAGIDLEVEVRFSLGSREQQEASASLPGKSPVRPVYRVVPEYPADAELVALSGEVVVEFVVGEKGEVRDAQVVQTSHSVFNDAAIKAIKQWAFIPARAQGQPKATRMQVPFVFKQPEGPLRQEVRIALPYGSERPELHATAQAAQAVIEQ